MNKIAEKLKAIVHEGNVRRVIVKHDGRTIAEFPLTAGVVGAVIAPVLAVAAGRRRYHVRATHWRMRERCTRGGIIPTVFHDAR